MPDDSDILNLINAETIKAKHNSNRALIIQPGAIGDCILTLPLAAFLKKTLHLGGVDFLGHTDYIGFYPGRTCVDSVSSLDSIEIHRMFIDSSEFILADQDPLIKAFSEYSWVISFLGEPDSNFEKNLIFTINCNQTSEVITLSSKLHENATEHIADYFIRQLSDLYEISLESPFEFNQECHIKPTKTDIAKGRDLLWEVGLEPQKKLVVIQPGGGALNKCWNVENYLAIVNELRSKNIQTVFLLGPAEIERFSRETIKKLADATKCLTEISLFDVLKIISCTDAFIGNDSGITHLAAAMGTHTIVVFGPTNPNVYKPMGPNVNVFIDNNENFTIKPSVELQAEIIQILLKNILYSNT